ncbi:MAG: exonuclease domain-containing protein [Thermomicrobiales bacterium]
MAGYAAPPTVSALGDFTALDVETTGLRPLTHRIIEVAAVRYRNGREVDSWVSFLNPDKVMPATIINLTGIRDVDLEDALRFRDIAGDLSRFWATILTATTSGSISRSCQGELRKRMSFQPGLRKMTGSIRLRRRQPSRSRGASQEPQQTFNGSSVSPEGRDHRAYDDAKRPQKWRCGWSKPPSKKVFGDPVSIRNLGAPDAAAVTRRNPAATECARSIVAFWNPALSRRLRDVRWIWTRHLRG